MKSEIEAAIAEVCRKLFHVDVAAELTRPDEQFGDYATNVALQLAKQLNKNPREIAGQIANNLQKAKGIQSVEVAGPGFINITLTDEALVKAMQTEPAKTMAGQTVVAEYSDPNPFKILHAGHVYTTIVGDAIANLMEIAGGTVHRVNYGGDVGRHVAINMWAILKKLGGEKPEKLTELPEEERANWLSQCYVEGYRAFENDEQAKAEIVELNKKIYQIHSADDHNSPLAQIYWTCRQWSYEAFDAFYARLGTKMERYYPESEVSELGLKLVRQHIGEVFEESEGAVVFKGDEYDLHTRVFINSEGLPTYEAKEVGLIIKKHEDYHCDRSIIVTANEQEQYMIVVLKAIEQFLPELAKATIHIPHGMVRLAGNVKMSSRLGNIIPANTVIDATAEANKRLTGGDDDTTLGAIKYAFLKTRIGGDLVYDPKESVSLEGNSGPYLQYAHARARSILAKAGSVNKGALTGLESGERSLARKISEYPEVVDKAVAELMPHHVCTYLYELAQIFNRFYEHNRVIGDERESTRLALVSAYADTLQKGLTLLGITAPNRL